MPEAAVTILQVIMYLLVIGIALRLIASIFSIDKSLKRIADTLGSRG